MHDRRVTGRLGLNTNGDKDMHPAIGKTGGCQCTAVRYELIGIPKMLYACHCSDCQKQSASAFGMSLITSRDDVNFSQGQERLKTWDTRGENGAIKRCAFCPDCGTRIFHAAEREDRPISIKAGSLEDTQWLQPVAHIWLRSAQPWIEIDHRQFRCFAQEPDDESALARLWLAQTPQV